MPPEPRTTRADFAARLIAEMRAALGAELEPLSIYPRRLLGRTIPAAWQLARMGLAPWRQLEA